MFGIDLSEDEQAQLFKDWLRRYLPFIGAGVAAVVIGIGGYAYYNSSREDTNRRATELLFELIEHSNTSIESPLQDAKARNAATNKAAALATALGALNADGYQAGMGRIQHARLLLANQADYAQIEEALGEALHSDHQLVAATATLLLANAAWANDDANGALKLLSGDFHPDLRPLARQLAGDIHLQAGNREESARAYAEAEEAGLESELLRLKQSLLAEDAR